MRTWVIELPWPKPPLSANDRMHWSVKARFTKDIRFVTHMRAKRIPALRKITVQLVWTVTDNRRRDEDNTYPTFKAACDGLVDAGIVPDDTPEFMVKDAPRIVRGERQNVRIEIREAS